MKKRKSITKQITKLSLLVVGILLSVLTVGYATYNANLKIAGTANVKYTRTDIYISDITGPATSNSAEETSPPTYTNLEAHFQVKTPEAASVIEYDVVIQNNTDDIKVLSEVTPLLNSNDASITYEVSGFKVGDAIKSKDAKTSHIKIYIKDSASVPENPITLLNVLFKFDTLVWQPLTVEFLSATDTGDLSENPDDVTFDIKVTNPNPVSANYYIASNSAMFTLKDTLTNTNGFTIEANGTTTHSILITLRSDVVYRNLQRELLLILRNTYPISEDVNIHTVTLTLPNNLKSTVLNSREVEKSPDSFAGIETTSGHLMRTNEIDELSYTYYYRGVIDNNYVSFAGFMWRIVRINSNGNVRIVLDENVNDTSKYNANYVTDNVENIEAAMTLVDYRNSDVRTKVEAWYDANIAPKEESKYVAQSHFCIDMSYQGPIETMYEHTVYYFTPYLHVGKDANTFTPDFTCAKENLFINHVALLTAEEILAAGGYWQTANDKYYLYNPNATGGQTSWTMSGSYFSASEKQAGVIIFNQDKEGLFDWVHGGNLTENYGFRPVISLNGNSKIAGEGTKENPYRIIG